MRTWEMHFLQLIFLCSSIPGDCCWVLALAASHSSSAPIRLDTSSTPSVMPLGFGVDLLTRPLPPIDFLFVRYRPPLLSSGPQFLCNFPFSPSWLGQDPREFLTLLVWHWTNASPFAITCSWRWSAMVCKVRSCSLKCWLSTANRLGFSGLGLGDGLGLDLGDDGPPIKTAGDGISSHSTDMYNAEYNSIALVLSPRFLQSLPTSACWTTMPNWLAGHPSYHSGRNHFLCHGLASWSKK